LGVSAACDSLVWVMVLGRCSCCGFTWSRTKGNDESKNYERWKDFEPLTRHATAFSVDDKAECVNEVEIVDYER
jgi:hypothetical protein